MKPTARWASGASSLTITISPDNPEESALLKGHGLAAAAALKGNPNASVNPDGDGTVIIVYSWETVAENFDTINAGVLREKIFADFQTALARLPK